jgi:hypothetical protein
MGGRGYQQLFGTDGDSHYSKADIAAAIAPKTKVKSKRGKGKANGR